MKGKIFKKIQHLVNPPIIQFSPPRSGSTLLWNTLRLCFPSKDVFKRHSISYRHKSKWNRSPIVSSIRNPLDSIASSIQRNGQNPSEKIIKEHMIEHERGLWDMLEISEKEGVKILKYERFAHDFDFMFSELEIFFKTKIPYDIKESIYNRYSIDKVKSKSDKLGKFSNFDSNDNIHGMHISRFKGATGYYREFFTTGEIEQIYSYFKDVFVIFDYDDPTHDNVESIMRKS